MIPAGFRRGVGWILSVIAAWGLTDGLCGAEPGGFVQDRFAIGLWVPPQTRDNLQERYHEMARAGFNVVIANSVSDPKAQIELCRVAGLKALVEATGSPETWPEGEACWGYHVTDEPGASAFPELGRRVAEIRRHRPGRLAYINLFPNYASPAQLGTPTYEEHVSRFLREVKPEVLSMDHYPLMRPDRDGRDGYLENLEVFRRLANGAGIPFWNFFHAMPFNDRIDPTEAQIRWQIHASLAYGAKGVLYFCYWTPGKGAGGAGEFPKGGAILTAEGIPTRHYDEARRINAELARIGPVQMQLTGEGVVRVRVRAGDTTNAVPAGGPIRALKVLRGDPPGEFLLGVLRHRDGRRAVWLVNHDHSYTAWPTVEFDALPGQVREVDRSTGREVEPLDGSPELAGFQCPLGAGEARLFLLPGGTKRATGGQDSP